MDFTHEVVLHNGMGFIKCYGAELSKTGNSYRIVLSICDCYKNTCSCYQEMTIPHWYVKEVNGPAEPTPKRAEAKFQPKPKNKKVKLNLDFQYYKGIQLQLIERSYAKGEKAIGRAKRFALNGTNQNVWIPNKHLHEDGTIKEGENIDYVFRKATRQLELAGYTGPIIGIKRTNVTVF